MIKLMLLFPPWCLGMLQIYFCTFSSSNGVRHKGDYNVLKAFLLQFWVVSANNFHQVLDHCPYERNG